MSWLGLETLTLQAGIGLQCADAYSGVTALPTVRCSIVNRASGEVVARSVSTPSGIHHWPSLPARIGGLEAGKKSKFEVLIEELSGSFLPFRMAWPLTTTTTVGGARLCRIELLSAPARPAPAGSSSLFASLVGSDQAPAAWVRVVLRSANGRETVGMSDARGVLALHLPFPLPERSGNGNGGALPTPPYALVTWTLAHSKLVAEGAELAASSLPGGVRAPLRDDWLVQPKVVAQKTAGLPDAIDEIRFDAGQPTVVRTAGLDPNHFALRLLSV